MMDLHDRMARFSGPAESTPDSVAEVDLVRGRRAVRRRRVVQATAGSAFGIAALAAAFSLTALGPVGAEPGSRPPAVAQSAPGGGLQLVAFTGEQPKDFTIDTVPAGFRIVSQGDGQLLLAPDELAAPRPTSSVPAVGEPTGGMVSYENKLGVYLEYFEQPQWGEQVAIGGRTAWLHDGQAWVEQAPRVYLVVQADTTIGLSRAQFLEIANGVHVSPDYLASYVAAKSE